MKIQLASASMVLAIACGGTGRQTQVVLPPRDALGAHLGGSVYWSDGEPVTSAAVAVTVQSSFEPDGGLVERCSGTILRHQEVLVDTLGRFDLSLRLGVGPSFLGCLNVKATANGPDPSVTELSGIQLRFQPMRSNSPVDSAEVRVILPDRPGKKPG